MPITAFNKARLVTIDTTDDFATATAAGYFDGIKDNLNVGEMILLTSSDAVSTLRVTAVDPSVTVENTESVLPPNSVGTPQLQNLAVTQAKLANQSVGTLQIILESITNDLIADNTIQEIKLAAAVAAKLNRIKAEALYDLTNTGVPGETVPVLGKGIVPGLPCIATCVSGSVVTTVTAITGVDEITFSFNAPIAAGDKVSYIVLDPV